VLSSEEFFASKPLLRSGWSWTFDFWPARHDFPYNSYSCRKVRYFFSSCANIRSWCWLCSNPAVDRGITCALRTFSAFLSERRLAEVAGARGRVSSVRGRFNFSALARLREMAATSSCAEPRAYRWSPVPLRNLRLYSWLRKRAMDSRSRVAFDIGWRTFFWAGLVYRVPRYACLNLRVGPPGREDLAFDLFEFLCPACASYFNPLQK